MPFLAFEGLDGAGKSTLIHGLKSELDQRQIPHRVTREPGGTSLGSEIRTLLLRVDGEAPTAKAEALLYQADRAHHVESVIRPALVKGEWVLSDRFAASTVAFQAGGRAISRSDVDWLNHFSTGGLQPDLYVLLDLTVEESVRRLSGRTQETDRFEREKHDFHVRVRNTFLELAETTPSQWLVLNAADQPRVLLEKLLAVLRSKRWLA